jgi:phosphinothricin acetyltransferase
MLAPCWRSTGPGSRKGTPFETCAPGWAEFSAVRLPAHRFVATTGGQVAGWVAASAVSGRCVYAGVVGHSVYVRPAARGRGIGRRLLEALIASTEAAGIWTIQSGIFPENAASLALHRAAGFRVVGTRERIGQHHGRWRDVVLIERRSPAVLSAAGQDGPQQASRLAMGITGGPVRRRSRWPRPGRVPGRAGARRRLRRTRR